MKRVIMAIAFLAAACGPTAEEIALSHHQACVHYSFEPGTEAYGMCRLQLEQNYYARQQAAAAAYMGAVMTGQSVRNAAGAP